MYRLPVDRLPVFGTFVVAQGVEEGFAECCVGGEVAIAVAIGVVVTMGGR